MKFVLCFAIFAFILNPGFCRDACNEDSNSINPPCKHHRKIEEFVMNVNSVANFHCNNIRISPSPLNYHKSKFHKHYEILWEKKSCESNGYMGVTCDLDKAQDLNGTSWKKLDSNKYREYLVINGTEESDSGIYRCIYRGNIQRILVLKIIAPVSLDGPIPNVTLVDTSNTTHNKKNIFTIRCNVSSKIPPEVYWFKQSHGYCENRTECDITENKICYCHIVNNITSYNTSNIYISKLKLYNARYTDSGTYACSAVTEYGKDYKTIVIKIPNSEETTKISLFLLFLIPFVLFIPILLIGLCYTKRKKQLKYIGPIQYNKAKMKDNIIHLNDYL